MWQTLIGRCTRIFGNFRGKLPTKKRGGVLKQSAGSPILSLNILPAVLCQLLLLLPVSPGIFVFFLPCRNCTHFRMIATTFISLSLGCTMEQAPEQGSFHLGIYSSLEPQDTHHSSIGVVMGFTELQGHDTLLLGGNGFYKGRQGTTPFYWVIMGFTRAGKAQHPSIGW